MDIQTAQQIVHNAIEGQPNSCLSEHARGLKEVYELLIALDRISQPTEKPPKVQLKLYHVTVTLEDEFLAENADEAWERAMDAISSRKGMQLCNHKIEEVT